MKAITLNIVDTLDKYRDIYKQALLENVIPFWEKHSLDSKYGGYFSCLDRSGTVYDTDKFIWLQARQVWTFAMLYNRVEKRNEWLRIASLGIEFLKKFGRDNSGNFYFSLDRQGIPLVHSYNIYSDCFAALAFHEFWKATGDPDSYEIGNLTYKKFLSRLKHPKGRFEKSTGNRNLQSFGLPMMTAYLSSELAEHLDSSVVNKVFDNCIQKITKTHYDEALGIIREFTTDDGSFIDCFEGRLINPGHGIEAMWFLMDIALKRNNNDLFSFCVDTCLRILEFSWDKKYGGIFYFMDAKGAPPQQLEWDQKLWWPHLEALIALSRAYLHTNRDDVMDWFDKVHQYTWDKFPDPENGEWYGYLNRQGEPLLNLKGGKWKGCFHLPRGLYECWQNFATLSDQSSLNQTRLD